MTRPLVQFCLLALVSIAGIAGMLLAQGGWEWIFFILAALPLGAAMIVWRIRATIGRFCDDLSARAAEW